MKKTNEKSAGLIMWDIENGLPKILLCHMGGPFFKRKTRSWSIPKGRIEEGETIIDTAKREFTEETDIQPKPPFDYIGSVKYKNGKEVFAFAFKSKFKGKIKSNHFEIEWPPNSGKIKSFPENDYGKMMTLEEAKDLIVYSQLEFIDKIKSYFIAKKIII